MSDPARLQLGFWSPARPRLGNGLPTWLDAPHIALPTLSIGPTQGGTWRVGVGIGGTVRGQYFGKWRWAEVSLGTLAELLAQWNDGPEQALREWWGEEPPEAESPNRTEKSLEDLGL